MREIHYFQTEYDMLKKLEEIEGPIVFPPYIIDYEGSLYEKLDMLSIVSRLRHIKQLGLTSTFWGARNAKNSRYDHSLSVATKVDHISQTHGLDDQRDIAVIAAMLHDAATTPLSDSVGSVKGLGDEENFERVIERCPELDKLLKEYSVSKKDLVRIVKGEDKRPVGQLINGGKIVDVDRFCYVNDDARRLCGLPSLWMGDYVADPFKSFAIYKGRIAFKDIDSVRQLLEARIKMFENYYKNSSLSAKESFLSKVTEDLLEKQIITKDSIFDMADYDFERIIRKNCGELGERIFSDGGFECYGTTDAGEKEVSDYLGRLTKKPFVVKRGKSIKPATETPLIINGEIKAYREWEPFHSKILESRASLLNRTNIFGYDEDGELREAAHKTISKFGC